ncbi:Transmembrane amino acid transporter family protein [Candida albicans]|uniref:Transmembrane amino acid transporter family protein n=1 Tax=Candida albicans TaxID=5476 RepID=A0A8H6BYR0_CANAX|nr:Transmembrane amino acid transporter family protein [Candida albicans]
MIEEDENTSLLSRRPSHSFLDTPIGSFKGPNSLHNFASSFTRAQSFAANKIDNSIHKKRSFFVSGDGGTVEDDETFDPELLVPSYRGERLSTLDQSVSPNNDVFFHDDVMNALNESRSRQNSTFGNSQFKHRIYSAPSFSSFRSSISAATTPSIFQVRKIEDEEGNVVTVLAGQSTAPQTIFNSVNVLIGVGLLALPVGLMKAGWVYGIPILLVCGLTTYWTACLLSKAMDTDDTIMTYADLGYAAYGSMAKLVISVLFSIDLLGAGVSLIVLFSDSLYALLGDDQVWTRTRFKILSFIVLTPFTFVPLPILSIISLFGILSTISITILVMVCGLLKPTAPGSLLETMPTNLYPKSLPDLLLAIGILMAPFGGHAIFPNLKSDMRHPYKFTQTLRSTYSITLLTDCSMAVLGFLMFGQNCSNEVTNTLLTTAGYPKWCYPLISGLICLVPLAKTPLNAKPIISTLDVLFGVANISTNKIRETVNSLGRFVIRIGVNAVFVVLAILFPEFDKIIGMLGASICFIICIILPCLFYVRLCGSKIRGFERFMVYSAIFISCVLASAATWAVEYLIKNYPLATVVTNDENGTIIANHIPFVLKEDPESGKKYLIAHIAKTNHQVPTLADSDNVLVIFQSADSYITPNYYPGKPETHKYVPTWDFACAHIYGSSKIIDDFDFVRSQITHLTDQQEAGKPDSWKVSDAPEKYLKVMQKAIAGLQIEIKSTQCKYKFEQDMKSADIQGVVDGLQKDGKSQISNFVKESNLTKIG